MLLGRDRERHELEKALADARLSRSAVLVFAGEIGIGKTTLLEFAADRARSAGMRVLRARAGSSRRRVCRSRGCWSCCVQRSPSSSGFPNRSALRSRARSRSGLRPRRIASRSVRRRSTCSRRTRRTPPWPRSSTMPTGSTPRARTRCCSRFVDSSPTRSRSWLPSARASRRSSMEQHCRRFAWAASTAPPPPSSSARTPSTGYTRRLRAIRWRSSSSPRRRQG
jgi:hypothetical protein